jgi:hypothetical protein
VVALVVAVVVLCFLVFVRDPNPQLRGFDSETVPTGAGDSSDSASGKPSDHASPSDGTSASDQPATDDPPAVGKRLSADFAEGDTLPTGTEIYDNESVGSGMALEDRLLQHGPPRGPVAVSTLETALSGDVRRIGVRLRFPGDKPGSVQLAAWQTSFVASRRDDKPIPPTGMRLLVSNGTWELTSGIAVIGNGEFPPVPGTMTFELYRQADRAWVVDPAGVVSPFQDPRIQELAGPWASWQLLEPDVSTTPAVIEAIWAG